MSLWTRLTEPADNEVNIPIHQFMAAVAEFQRGEITVAQFKTMFNLSTAEGNALTSWYTNVFLVLPLTREMVHDRLLLAADGQYDNATAKAKLGM